MSKLLFHLTSVAVTLLSPSFEKNSQKGFLLALLTPSDCLVSSGLWLPHLLWNLLSWVFPITQG